MADVFSHNRVVVLGRVGNPPRKLEAKEISTTICAFEVATTEKLFKTGREPTSETDWHDIICFGKLAQFVLGYVKKGNLVVVEGKLKHRIREDKDTGKKRKFTSIRASEVTFIGKMDVDSDEENSDNEDNSKDPF